MAFGRKFRNVVLLAKIETVKGTDPTPTGADNAILPVGEISITPIEADRVPRNILRGYFGAPDQLLGSTWQSIRFSVELAGSGTAGTAPAWGPLLRACAFAETVSAGSRVDYTPVSSALESVTIYAYCDGLLYKLIGAHGTLNGVANVGGLPVLNFEFWAPFAAPAAATNATPTLTAWKVPQIVNDANTTDLVIGGAYATGAVTGGTSYVSGGVEFDLGNVITRRELIGAKEAVPTDRAVTGTVKTLDLTAAQEVTVMADIAADTARSIGLLHGTAAGNKVLIFFAQARLLGLTPVNLEGVWTSDLAFEAPPASGNDDMRIVVL
ncbi:MAG: hypothetical protein AB7N70_13915 [Dehalococcoidia bacterium]